MKSSVSAALLAVLCLFSGNAIADIEKEVECLTRNVYFEAGNESFAGKLAVAQVTLNRSKDPRFPSGICQVIHQVTKQGNRTFCQFSWYCTNKRYIQLPTYSQAYRDSEMAARIVLLTGIGSPKLSNALYFHSKHVNPNWGKKRIATIGNHVFYADNKK